MYVEPVLVSSFLHLLPLHSWSQQLYSPVSAAVEFARISWLYLSSCFILGRRKTKGTDKHRCISSYISVSSPLVLIFFYSYFATDSPFAFRAMLQLPLLLQQRPAYMSRLIDFNFTQVLPNFCLVQLIPGFLSVSTLKLGCDCYRQYVHLCFVSVCPRISHIFMLQVNPHASQSFFDIINCSTASIVFNKDSSGVVSSRYFNKSLFDDLCLLSEWILSHL